MPDLPAGSTGVVSTLTDGTGVSAILSSKLVKDFVVDIGLALPGALIAINVGGVEAALASPAAVSFVLADTIGRALYRVIMRWAQS